MLSIRLLVLVRCCRGEFSSSTVFVRVRFVLFVFFCTVPVPVPARLRPSSCSSLSVSVYFFLPRDAIRKAGVGNSRSANCELQNRLNAIL